ncbi:MAG TPA: ribonuclease HII [Lachnospiraceae bacterium]|nr:ribonuclease HII [Lachnospiraceae bacterium]
MDVGMEQKINEINKIYQAADITMLPEFISRYGCDTRPGVVTILTKARKKIDALEKEKKRSYQMSSFEREYASYSYLCGIDEVGRGPLAGPVVAGAVILKKECSILYLNDSKQLSAKKREELYEIIMDQAIATGIGLVSPERIDEINILQATYEAMGEAIYNLGVTPDILLNDAVTIPKVNIKQVPIIKGDAKSISIAAASIIAKVTRDKLMIQYDEIMPEYGFASNKGYGSAMHIEALKKYGPTPIHRRSFIKNFI